MPSDETTSQNPTPEENPSPQSPQEPTEPSPVNTTDSEPSEALPEALESSPIDFEVKSTDIPPSDSTLTEQENEPKTEEKQDENEANSEPEDEPESQTAQTPVNEPLPASAKSSSEAKEEVKLSHIKSTKIRQLLEMARNAIQFRKRKKLNKVMSLFLEKSKITNDEVEKLLHVSDATATRYLSQLEKEGKIKQSGKTGKGVSYSRI